jgi:hypothetical protein
MDGEVGQLAEESKCNAILCPPLTWNENGKEISASSCKECAENESLFGQTTCGQSQSSREREILDKLYSMTGGRYWTHAHDNWLRPGLPICQREGINCASDDSDEGVREILMNGFGMRGTIPTEIWELPIARELAFTNNAVDVSFHGIENATALRTLKLSQCHLRTLYGLGNATTSLSELHIAANQFNGTIPEELFDLDHLHQIFLNNNHFSGKIPSGIKAMTGLTVLKLSNNKLTGPMPSDLGLLTNLQQLDVKQNELSGAIPLELQTHQQLKTFHLSNQHGKKFQGAFPSFEGSPLLTTIDASQNAFSGWLPSNFLSEVDPSETLKVDLSLNLFEGPVPEAWSKFQALEIDLSGNLLTALPETLCSNVGWNDGMVGILSSCNAILCPKGSAQPAGRQTDAEHPCQECPSGVESAPYLGSRECIDPEIVAQTEILRSFYMATNGTNWLSQTNWLSNYRVCAWFGVQCDENGFVEELDLGSNHLIGGYTNEASISIIFTLPGLKVRLARFVTILSGERTLIFCNLGARLEKQCHHS